MIEDNFKLITEQLNIQIKQFENLKKHFIYLPLLNNWCDTEIEKINKK